MFEGPIQSCQAIGSQERKEKILRHAAKTIFDRYKGKSLELLVKENLVDCITVHTYHKLPTAIHKKTNYVQKVGRVITCNSHQAVTLFQIIAKEGIGAGTCIGPEADILEEWIFVKENYIAREFV